MISTDFRNELNELVDGLSVKAAYSEHPAYGLVPDAVDLDNREWGSVPDVYDGIKHTVLGMSIMRGLKDQDGVSKEDQIHKAITDNTDYDSFSLLSQEKGTIVLLGKSENSVGVLRIAPHSDSKFVSLMSTRRDDSVRTGFQGMLQGRQDPITVGDNALQVEVTPLGQVVSLTGDEKNTYGRYLEALTEGTCYTPEDLKEVMLLPDSTMVMFDAGECKYTSDYWDMTIPEQMAKEAESKNVIEMRLKSWGLPDQLIPINPDGGLKQDQFFPPFQEDIRTTQSNDLDLDGLDVN